MAKASTLVAGTMCHLGTAIALLCLLLCLAMGGLWVVMRGGPQSPSLQLVSIKLDGRPRSEYGIQAQGSGVAFVLKRGLPTDMTGPYTFVTGPYMPRDGTVTPAVAAWNKEVGGFVHSFGRFAVACIPDGSQLGRYQRLYGHTYVIRVPYWAPVVLFVLPPVIWGMFYQRRRRIAYRVSKGLCRECGYDLRASKERCPECGTAIEAGQVVEEGAKKTEDA